MTGARTGAARRTSTRNRAGEPARRLLGKYVDQNILVIGTHFATPHGRPRPPPRGRRLLARHGRLNAPVPSRDGVFRGGRLAGVAGLWGAVALTGMAGLAWAAEEAPRTLAAPDEERSSRYYVEGGDHYRHPRPRSERPPTPRSRWTSSARKQVDSVNSSDLVEGVERDRPVVQRAAPAHFRRCLVHSARAPAGSRFAPHPGVGRRASAGTARP